MDLKATGYFVSTVSVVLLAIVAWPGANEPRWHAWVVIVGSLVSIGGMFLRYLSHRQDKHDIERAARDDPPKHG